MRIAIILNGISRRKKFFYSNLLPVIQQKENAEVFETQTATDAAAFASQIAREKYDLILAAGGDGTVHQVLNGMLSNNKENLDLPVLTVLPTGSGNDFARTLNITADPREWEKRLTTFKTQRVDIGLIKYQSSRGATRETYFINVASAGMGPEVLSNMSFSKHYFGSAVAYYTAILSTFYSYQSMSVQIKTAEWEWTDKLRTLAIGNGKFFGHGLCIAPEGRVDDGILSAFICGNVSVLDFIRYSATLKNSGKIKHPKIKYASSKSFYLTSDSPCKIEADGELLGFLPATIEVLPGRIKFLV